MKNICKKTNTVFLITTIVYIMTSLFMSLLSVRSIEPPIAVRLIMGEIIIIIPGMIFILCSKTDLGEWLPFRKVKKSTIGFTILVTLAISPVLYFLNLLSQLFVKNEALNLLGQMSDAPAILVLLVVGVLGPVCEEITFRGIFFGGFKTSGRIIGAILWSGLLFGLFHMNLNQMGYAFVMGVTSAILIEVSGSIWPAIILHVLTNTYNVLQLYITEFAYSRMGLDMNAVVEIAGSVSKGYIGVMAAILLPNAIGGIALAWLLFRAIMKREGRREYILSIIRPDKDNPEESKKPHVISFSGILGAVICIIMIFAMELILNQFHC